MAKRKIIVTHHAIRRFRKRSNAKWKPNRETRRMLVGMVARGQQFGPTYPTKDGQKFYLLGDKNSGADNLVFVCIERPEPPRVVLVTVLTVDQAISSFPNYSWRS